MILEDKNNDYEKELSLTEYLASFWNSDAVQKIREARASRENHAFKDDKEFEKSVLSDEYKNNPLIEAIKKIKKMEQEAEELERGSNTNRKDYKKRKSPTVLSELSRRVKNF